MVNALLSPLGLKIARAENGPALAPVDIPPEDVAIYAAVKDYTLTGPERVYALINAVRYVAASNIPGAIVECGVWKGGSMMAAALTLLGLGRQDRELYLFDTFEGMPQPTGLDVAVTGRPAAIDFQRSRTSDDTSEWCNASIELVAEALRSTGYEMGKVQLIKGKVEQTIPAAAPSSIALLRLDTDWYESTHHELEHLFPRLSSGGVIIIDDYGHWQGARRATDEFLSRNHIRLLLNRIDYTARIGVKA